MAISQIIDRELRIDIIDPEQAAALAHLDTNGDEIVSVHDFTSEPLIAATSAATQWQVFYENVAAALSGGGAITNDYQHQGLIQFFSLYNQVKRFDVLTTEWEKHKTNTGCCELEFDPTYWNVSVLPELNGAGEFTPEKLQALSTTMYLTAYYLTGHDVPAKIGDLPSRYMGCGRSYIQELHFPMADVPAFLQGPLVETMQAYGRSVPWLLQYKDIECEGTGCPWPDEVRIRAVAFWPPPVGSYPEVTNDRSAWSIGARTILHQDRSFAALPKPSYGSTRSCKP